MSSRESNIQSPFQNSSELALPNSTSPLTPEGSQPSRRISAASSIVFIDSQVSDYQTLVSGVQAGTEVHILDSRRDEIAQITQTLAGRSNISSLHILSHGSAGGVQLGSDWLGVNTLDRYAPQLQSWARALTDDADILLYGCDVAAGEQGQAFIQSLSQLTGADIAASNDQTGNATLGGDWDLEVSQGTINTPLGFDRSVLAAYEHILPVNLPGYTESVYVSGLPALAAGLTVDLASNTLYLADNSTNGILRKVTTDRTVSTVSTNFATNGLYPYVATDLQYANGSVYTSVANGTSGGNLIQINTSTGTSTTLTTFAGFGNESGLANVGSKIYVTSGQGSSGTGEIRQYDLSTNSSASFANLPQGASSLEFDPVKNKFYFSVMGGGIYSADPTTGAYTLLASTPPGSGNFAIDPSGDYLYTKTNAGEVLRISTTNGSTTTFQTGVSSDGDLVFGRSSSGTGGSLYVSDGNRILEVSGFAAPIVPGSGGTGVYTRSNFVENLQRVATGLAYDQATRTLYFANDDGTGTLNKVLSNRTVSTVATNFTKGGFYPYAATDIQYANGSIYTSLDNGNLVQIDPNSGNSAIVTNLPGFGSEAGLALNAGKLLITSGSGGGVRELREFDPNTGMNTLKNGNLPSGSSSLEYDPVRNKYYFSANGQFFAADPVTGTYNLLASPGGPGNFAVDPSGDYLYTRVGNNVVRVSTIDGTTSTFQTGFISGDFGSDLVFGVSSSGVGGSLYIGDGNSIVEISGFATPPVIPGSGGSTGTYTRSVYASSVGSPAALAFDSATKTLYFAEKNGGGSLRKVGSDRTVSAVATNFANGGFYPYAATDIQFADGSIYTALDGGNLIKINLSNGTSTTVTNFSGFGGEAGLAAEAGRILVTSGNSGVRELREYDPSTGTSKLRIANLPSAPSSFEFDPVRDKYYFSTTTGQFYVADPATGMSSLLASLSSNSSSILGNFAIDPFGEFLYTRVGSDIIRISTSNGSTSIFQSGFNSDSLGSDLVFGTASSGNGYSLYVSDFDQIIEIAGFSAQVVSNAPSDSYLTLKTLDEQASESPTDRATYELRRNNKTGTLVVNLAIDPGSTASIDDYILSVNTGRISIVGSTITVTVPDGVDSVFLNVRAIDDIRGEAAETLKLNLLKGAYVTDTFNNTATTTILANDTPTISINNVTVTEGNSGVTKATFTISLSNPSDLPVSFNYATADGTATASSNDYTSIANSITFTPGTTSVTVSVDIKGDTEFEQTETLNLILSNAINGTIANGVGTATILNDDSSLTAQASSVTFSEDNTYVFQASDFSFSATNEGTLQSVQITQLPTIGQLFLDTDGNNTQDAGESISANQTLTLTDIPKLKFKPVADANGSNYANFKFKVSDGQALSASDATMTLNVTPVNDAPMLDVSGNPTLPSIYIGNTNSTGTRISDLISSLGGSKITDIDNAVSAIALTSVDNTNGAWQFSTDSGSTWQDVGVVSDSAARVLGATSLYTAGLNTLPSSQSWLSYTNLKLSGSFPVPGNATQTPDTGGTNVNTSADINNYAGYSNYNTSQQLVNSNFPTLDRAQGFGVAFNLQVLSDSHTNNDRAAFSIILLGSDKRGIELAFQDGKIFAQNDDSAGGQLFTAGENAVFDTKLLASYRVAIKDDTYQLFAGNTLILTGAVRDYHNWQPPSGFPSPYLLSNFVFLGDNTTSAQGSFYLTQVALQTDTRLRFVPNAGYTGNAQISFRAWDGTNGVANGASGINASLNGGTTAFSTATETATITVNPLPTLSINDVSQAEGNSGTKTYTFTVTLSQASTEAVTVNYTTIDGSATVASGDYLATSGTLTFNAGEVSKTIVVVVKDDTQFESNETFFVNLVNPTNATISAATGTGMIIDDDTASWKVEGIADFDGDGDMDILRRNYSNGQNTIWKMNGTMFESAVALQTVSDTNIRIEGVADFDGDGRIDILWRNYTTGWNSIWKMNGMTLGASIALPTVGDLNVKIAGIADFDGDGKVDILWRNYSTGWNTIWKMNGTSFAASIALPTVGDLNVKIAGIADFDGDGKVDILWRNYSTGWNTIWKMNGTSFAASIALPTVGDLNVEIAGIADFDGDGKVDILWRNYSTGWNTIWKMNGTSFAASVALPTASDIDAQIEDIADFDGDGNLDILWRNRRTGWNTIWKMNGTSLVSSIALPTA